MMGSKGLLCSAARVGSGMGSAREKSRDQKPDREIKQQPTEEGRE
ncbi:hypothetical protein Q0O91_14040 [Staphylococcus aureus]|nr:hypothetical protein [Staphylococcus aureus]